MKKSIFFASLCLTSIGLSGCSAPAITDARYLEISNTSNYFSYKKDKAITYFVCGSATQKNFLFGDIDMTKNFWCSFSINGKSYEKLNTSVIARLELEPGEYTVARPDNKLGKIKTSTIDLKPGSTTTFVANFTQTINLTGKGVLQSLETIDGPVPYKFRKRTPVSM